MKTKLTLFAVALVAVLVLSGCAEPSTPYDSWPFIHQLSGKRAIENPPEIKIDNFTTQPPINEFARPDLTATVTNGFAFPVGLVMVTVTMLDSSGVIVGETSDSIGGIPAGGRWQMSVYMKDNATDARISKVLVVAP